MPPTWRRGFLSVQWRNCTSCIVENKFSYSFGIQFVVGIWNFSDSVFFAKFFSNRRKVTKLQVDLSGRVKPMCAEHYSEDAETDVTRWKWRRRLMRSLLNKPVCDCVRRQRLCDVNPAAHRLTTNELCDRLAVPTKPELITMTDQSRDPWMM